MPVLSRKTLLKSPVKKLYGLFTTLLCLTSFANSVVAAVNYVDDTSLELSSIVAIVCLFSLLTIVVTTAEFLSLKCFLSFSTSFLSYGIYSLVYLTIDLIFIAIYIYFTVSLSRQYEEIDFSVAVVVLSGMCILFAVCRAALTAYGILSYSKTSNSVLPFADADENEEEQINIFKAKKMYSNSNMVTIKLPVTWDHESEQTLVQVPEQSEEYQEVVSEFLDKLNSNNVEVVQVQRIQNIPLYSQYKIFKDKLLLHSLANKRILYYGTDDENLIENICLRGFDMAEKGQSLGLYFSTVSEFYYKKDEGDEQKEHKMLRVRVTTGDVISGDLDVKVAPKKPNGKQYHSVTNENETLFVGFNNSQSYPDYLITYITNIES